MQSERTAIMSETANETQALWLKEAMLDGSVLPHQSSYEAERLRQNAKQTNLFILEKKQYGRLR
ncbi:hypothetical protein ACKC9G_18570 [Pokkaliibacter sp. CJK22405]|uniref:hypothetical protein n=1 Tax=Pokkaliibacter sp. CJK22405 TaxID=3384615 RepID=UPI003984CE60